METRNPRYQQILAFLQANGPATLDEVVEHIFRVPRWLSTLYAFAEGEARRLLEDLKKDGMVCEGHFLQDKPSPRYGHRKEIGEPSVKGVQPDERGKRGISTADKAIPQSEVLREQLYRRCDERWRDMCTTLVERMEDWRWAGAFLEWTHTDRRLIYRSRKLLWVAPDREGIRLSLAIESEDPEMLEKAVKLGFQVETGHIWKRIRHCPKENENRGARKETAITSN